MEPFCIFGSASSKDYDVIVFVKELGTIEENHKYIKMYDVILKEYFSIMKMSSKKVNSNLGVLDKGILVKVFKGSPDEVNNSLYNTYQFHKQFHPNPIEYIYERTGFYTQLKLKRCFRFILSFYSRIPEWRPTIKEALRGGFDKRLDCIKKIDFIIHKEFPGKKDVVEDIYKVLAFQLAQTLYLYKLNGIEIFSKEDVLKYIPGLKNPIMRLPMVDNDYVLMNNILKELIDIAESEIKNMPSLLEEIFNN